MNTTNLITFLLQIGIGIFYGISMIMCFSLILKEAGAYRNFKKAISPKGVDFANNFQKARVMIGARERQLFLEKKRNGISLLQFIVISDIKFGFIKGVGIIDNNVKKLENRQVFMAKISYPQGEEEVIFYTADTFEKIIQIENRKFLFSAKSFMGMNKEKIKKSIRFEIPIPCIN